MPFIGPLPLSAPPGLGIIDGHLPLMPCFYCRPTWCKSMTTGVPVCSFCMKANWPELHDAEKRFLLGDRTLAEYEQLRDLAVAGGLNL